LPNVIKVAYRLNGKPLRDIISKVKDIGFKSAKYKPDDDNNSIRDMLDKEVARYRNKFVGAMIVWIPIMILMWVIPYTNPKFLTENAVYNGMSLYIFLLLGLSSII